MRCIYKITFPNGKFYIGQTANFKTRLANHESSKGKGQPLLEAEWELHEPESIEIVKECKSDDELNQSEIQYIEALKPQLNTLPGGEACRGLNHPRAQHDEDTYKEVLRLFIETDAQYQDIEYITGVKYSCVRDIVFRRKHAWLDNYFDPKLVEAAHARRKPAAYVLYDRNNVKHEAETIIKLAESLNIQQVPTVSRALRDNAKYSRYGLQKTPHELITIKDPEGNIYETNVYIASEMLEEYGLSKYQRLQITQRKKSQGGWSVIKNLTL